MQLPDRIEAEVPIKTWEITTGGPVGTQNSRWYCADKTLVRLGSDRRLTCMSAFCGRNCSHSKAVLDAFPGIAQDSPHPDDAFVMGPDEAEGTPMQAVEGEATAQQTACYVYPLTPADAKRMHDMELQGIPSVTHDLQGREQHVLRPRRPDGDCPICNKQYTEVCVRRNCTVYLPRPQYAQANVNVTEWRCSCQQVQHKYDPHYDALWQHSSDLFISVRCGGL